MGTPKNFRLGRGLTVLIGVCGLLLAGALGFLAFGQPSASAAFDGLPTETPRRDLPIALDQNRPTDDAGLTVLDQTQIGDFIVVVGNFTEVETRDGRILQTSGAYAYDINTGALLEPFLPELTRSNGNPTSVNAVAPAGGNNVFIAGEFNRAEDVFHNRIAKYNLLTGEIDNSFSADFNAAITELRYNDGRLFVGGEFTSVNGVSRQRLAEVNPNSGAVVNSFRFDITQSSRTPGTPFGPRYIGVTPDDILVVAHRGEMVAGEPRTGIALIDLKSNNLLGYSTNFWNGLEVFLQDAAVSPDGSYVVLVSNGFDFPAEGRDVGIRFDISDRHTSNQSERWIARNFDSTFSVAISDDAVFMGGHFCNVEGPGSANPFPGVGQYGNENSCFGATPGSRFPGVVNRDQLAAFDPVTGHALDWDPGSSAFRGVQSLEVIDRGLLIGHDGQFLGRDGADRRAWNVGLHGFLDFANPDGRPTPHECGGLRATIVGTNSNDVITGTSGRDIIVGLGGNDTIRGLNGNDVICGNEGRDVIHGGKGADIIYGNQGGDTLNGNNGVDTIYGGKFNDIIDGGGGRDVLEGNLGDDRILGGTDSDELDGGEGRDVLQGQRGHDQLQGNAGWGDTVSGDLGNDRCVGFVFGQPDNPNDVISNCESR